MQLLIQSTTVKWTIGALLLLKVTRLMHSLNGKTIYKTLCSYVTNNITVLENVIFPIVIINMIINIIYNRQKNKYK